MTNANRYFRFTFLLGGDIASFDQFTDADEIRNGIFAFSSFTPVVYVQPSATGTVKVSVEELTCPLDNPVTPEIEGNCTVGGLSGTATINVDPTNTATVAFESHNPLVPNPLVPNPLVPNPLVPNPLVPNPLVPNPLVPNITASNSTLQNATVYDVQYRCHDRHQRRQYNDGLHLGRQNRQPRAVPKGSTFSSSSCTRNRRVAGSKPATRRTFLGSRFSPVFQ